MCICKVDSGCRCLDLRTGCYIIASVSLVIGISAVIMLIGLTVVDDETIKEILMNLFVGVDINILLKIVNILWIFSLVTCFAYIAITGSLFYGLIKNKRAWMRPYVISHNIMASMRVLSLISGAIILLNFFYILAIIIVALDIYFTIIVNSFYKQMESILPPPVTGDEDNYHEHNNLSSVDVQETNSII